ncbi:hypothetical protein CBP51_05120 [Cellvibrio mixtus]|uniref:Uncharacterized protein n=1 Tax=Cellvibrio mixtus TaxID=39650 RepID=A0A266QAL3_9GAMM|nr:hypothetical protein [Cellvibrio mixtus]OZY86411.1 hypothetical protein CBP51_05120 [Cellvibrio mixtus]
MDYRPYSFQVDGKHLGTQSIMTAVNLLLHGAITKVAYNGSIKNVALKAHVLRHAFASFSVNIEKIPVDVVAMLLNQKHLPVTKYYSEPTLSTISHHHSSIADSMLASIDLGSEVIRLPKELVDLYDDAKSKVGTLTEVIGGTCVSHGFCAARFSCIGCAGKVPDPSKKDVVVRKLQWALKEKEWCKKEGLSAEVRKMDMLIRDCNREIEEMNVIKAYTEDADKAVKIFDSSKAADKWISNNEP